MKLEERESKKGEERGGEGEGMKGRRREDERVSTCSADLFFSSVSS